jgi:hypothetical protein
MYGAPMNKESKLLGARVRAWQPLLLGAAIAASLPACGGAVGAGSAVGKVGQDLSARAQTVPQGAGACAMKEALAAQPGGAEKSLDETCSKPIASDQLWRKSIVVLAAHGATLDSVASGGSGDTAGQVEAAGTGVNGKDWIQVESSEQPAADAVAALVEQMSSNAAKDDLEKRVQDAAPHVKTICEGLTAYLDQQASALADMAKEVEKKRVSKSDRRCTMLDNKSICVGDSATDRAVYARAYGEMATAASNHVDARNAVAGFCASHRKLEDAAANGTLDDDATFSEVVAAVKAAQKAPPAPAAAPAAAAPPPKK